MKLMFLISYCVSGWINATWKVNMLLCYS